MKRTKRVETMMVIAALCTIGITHLQGEEPLTTGADVAVPLTNVWTQARIDFKATLAGYGEPLDAWMTSDGYSDNVYRSKTAGILIRTGVVAKKLGMYPGFYTSTTVEWDLKSDTARIVEIANWHGGSHGGANPMPAYKEHPTPNPRHTYDGICYVPEEDAMYMMFGAYKRMISKDPTPEGQALIEDERNNTWCFSFASNRWAKITNSPASIGLPLKSIFESHLVHWPEQNSLLFMDCDARAHAEFDLATQQWKGVPVVNKPPMNLYISRSAWDSKRQLWIFRRGPELCSFDPRERKFEALPNCWEMKIPDRNELKAMAERKEAADPRLNCLGICYIPKHDVYLVTGPTGNDTRVYQVEKQQWRSLKAGEIALPSPNGYCQYSSELDRVALSYQLQCYTLKFDPEGLEDEVAALPEPAKGE